MTEEHTQETKTEEDIHHHFHINHLQTKISLLSTHISNKKDILKEVLTIVLSDDTCFYSLTVSNEEISIFIDTEKAKLFEKYTFINRIDGYSILQFFENSNGIQSTGIVNRLSDLFTKHDISILYVNSYNNNYILLEDKNVESVMKMIDVEYDMR